MQAMAESGAGATLDQIPEEVNSAAHCHECDTLSWSAIFDSTDAVASVTTAATDAANLASNFCDPIHVH